MSGDRHAQGMRTLHTLHSDAGRQMLERVREVSPDMARLIVECGYGDVWSRPGLSLRDRELVTITALTTAGNALPQLRVHMQAALAVGCTRQEIVEAVIHTTLYAGFPAAMNALLAAGEVFAEADGAAGGDDG